mmetsp:Transcript_27027/g.76323  ORF Transcript_27027/g.76323 Transcript_27027/m.76323 type:complete len:416 (+) Transcript_27027:590-1837(+)
MTMRSKRLAPPGPTQLKTLTGKARTGSATAAGWSRAIFKKFSASVRIFWSMRWHLTNFRTNSSLLPPFGSLRNQTPSFRPPRKPCISSTVAWLPTPSLATSCVSRGGCVGLNVPDPICSSPTSRPRLPLPAHVYEARCPMAPRLLRPLCAGDVLASLRLPSTPVPMNSEAAGRREAAGALGAACLAAGARSPAGAARAASDFLTTVPGAGMPPPAATTTVLPANSSTLEQSAGDIVTSPACGTVPAHGWHPALCGSLEAPRAACCAAASPPPWAGRTKQLFGLAQPGTAAAPPVLALLLAGPPPATSSGGRSSALSSRSAQAAAPASKEDSSMPAAARPRPDRGDWARGRTAGRTKAGPVSGAMGGAEWPGTAACACAEACPCADGTPMDAADTSAIGATARMFLACAPRLTSRS